MNTMKEKGKIVNDGMGGFLNPPKHPEHNFSVETDLRRHKENRGGMSLTVALDCDWLDDETKKEVSLILNNWEREKLPLEHEEVKNWTCLVMGYFHDCYQSDNGSWNASDLKINKNLDPFLHENKHAGVNLIRKFYPEFHLSFECLGEAYWGTKPEKAVLPVIKID